MYSETVINSFTGVPQHQQLTLQVDTLKVVGFETEGLVFLSVHFAEPATAVYSYHIHSALWEQEFLVENRVNVLHVSVISPFRSVTYERRGRYVTTVWEQKSILLSLATRVPCPADIIRSVPSGSGRPAERLSTGGGWGGSRQYFLLYFAQETAIRIGYLNAKKKMANDQFEPITGAYVAAHYARQTNHLYVLTSDSLVTVYSVHVSTAFAKMHVISYASVLTLKEKVTRACIPLVFAAAQPHDRTLFVQLIVPILVESTNLYLSIETEDITSCHILSLNVNAVPRISLVCGLLHVHEAGYGTHMIDIEHMSCSYIAFYPEKHVSPPPAKEAGLSRSRAPSTTTEPNVYVPMVFANIGHVFFNSIQRELLRIVLPGMQNFIELLSNPVLSVRARVGAVHIYLAHTHEQGPINYQLWVRALIGLPDGALETMLLCEHYLCCYHISHVMACLPGNPLLDPATPVYNSLEYILKTLPPTTLRRDNENNVTLRRRVPYREVPSRMHLQDADVTSKLNEYDVTDPRLILSVTALLDAFLKTLQGDLSTALLRCCGTNHWSRFRKLQKIVCATEQVALPILDSSLRDMLATSAKEMLPCTVFTHCVASGHIEARTELLKSLPRRTEGDDDLKVEIFRGRSHRYKEQIALMSPDSMSPRNRLSLKSASPVRLPSLDPCVVEQTTSSTSTPLSRPRDSSVSQRAGSLNRAGSMNRSGSIEAAGPLQVVCVSGYYPLDTLLADLDRMHHTEEPLDVRGLREHLAPLVPEEGGGF